MQVQDKCSFEWAKKLQDAGFVAPAYEPGQIWYDKIGRPTIIANVWPSGIMNTANLKTGAGGRVMNVPEGSVYAPGVSELMKDISFNAYYSPDVYYRIERKDFRVAEETPGGAGTMQDISGNANICDALAEAWIANRKGVPA